MTSVFTAPDASHAIAESSPNFSSSVGWGVPGTLAVKSGLGKCNTLALTVPAPFNMPPALYLPLSIQYQLGVDHANSDWIFYFFELIFFICIVHNTGMSQLLFALHL